MKIFLKSVSMLLVSGLLISCDPVKEKPANPQTEIEEITDAAKVLRKFGQKIRKKKNVLTKDDQKILKYLEKIFFPSSKSITNDAVMTSSMNFNTQEFKTMDSITGDIIDSCGLVDHSGNNPTVCNYEFTELPDIVQSIFNSEGALTGKVITSTGVKTVTFKILIKAFNEGSWCETDILAGKGYQTCITPITRSR